MRRFPDADMLGMPYVPPAPSLPEKNPLPFAVRTMQTAMEAMYGRDRKKLLHKQEQAVVDISRQLGLLGVLPAEWMILRFRSFSRSSIADKFPVPPFNFIFSQKAIDDWLERQDFIAEVRIPRRFLGLQSREAVKAWCAAKAGKASWERYDNVLLSAQQENLALQAELNSRVALGEFVWFSQL